MLGHLDTCQSLILTQSLTAVVPVIKFSRNAVPSPVFVVPPSEIAIPPPKVVVPPPGNVFTVHTVFFGQLILGKIINIVATRCQILRLKCTKFDFGWGCAPYPAGTYSAPQDTLDLTGEV